ncbi:MAG: hypothetical protein PHQ81_08480 [Methanofollis sp.]|nr:hypothetical protein [Methanofollis sp.]
MCERQDHAEFYKTKMISSSFLVVSLERILKHSLGEHLLEPKHFLPWILNSILDRGDCCPPDPLLMKIEEERTPLAWSFYNLPPQLPSQGSGGSAPGRSVREGDGCMVALHKEVRISQPSSFVIYSEEKGLRVLG